MEKSIKQYCPYLDKLRVFLTCVVIFHHTAIAFGASGGWYYKSSELWEGWSKALMSLIMGIDQSYFMALFFFISALLISASYERKGAVRFLKDRLIRLGIPLLMFILLLNPAIVGLVGEFRAVSVDWKQIFLHYHKPGPMWFVLTLMVFELLYVGYRILRPQKKATNQMKYPSVKQIIMFMLTAGVVAFLLRLDYPIGKSWFGLQFGYFPLYIGMYGAGLIAARQKWLEQIEWRTAIVWLTIVVVAIVAFAAFCYVNRDSGGSDSGGWNRLAFAYAMWEPILCVGISYFLLTVFKRWGNTPNHIFRMLAADSYMTYILHPFFVVLGTYLAQKWNFNPWEGLMFVCATAIVVTFCTAHLIRQISLVRKCGW